MFKDKNYFDRVMEFEIYNIQLYEVILLIFIAFCILYIIIDIIEEIIIKMEKK
jgi:hypothetical protein